MRHFLGCIYVHEQNIETGCILVIVKNDTVVSIDGKWCWSYRCAIECCDEVHFVEDSAVVVIEVLCEITIAVNRFNENQFH